MDFVVTELFQQRIGDLGQAETLLGLDVQRDNGNAVEQDVSHLEVEGIGEL